MIITSGFIQAIALFITMLSGAGDINDVMRCEVVELSEYGFEQSSEYNEYVCANQADYTYFRVVEDKDEILTIGDEMVLGIDAKTGDVIKAVKLP